MNGVPGSLCAVPASKSRLYFEIWIDSLHKSKKNIKKWKKVLELYSWIRYNNNAVA